eukprot:Lankesteria_metandrocarpae@DN1189_c0_g1_i1.p1
MCELEINSSLPLRESATPPTADNDHNFQKHLFLCQRSIRIDKCGLKGDGLYVHSRNASPKEQCLTLNEGIELFSEVPFSFVLRNDCWKSHCFRCFSFLPKIVHYGCKKCKLANFCSRECQTRESAHSRECVILKKLNTQKEKIRHDVPASSLGDYINEGLLLYRVVRRILNENNSTTKKAEEFKNEMPNIAVTNKSEANGETGCIDSGKVKSRYEVPYCSIPNDLQNMCASVDPTPAHISVLTFVKESGVMASIPNHLLLRLSVQFSCNNFQIMDSNMNFIGWGVYPLASKINHDCSPNAIAIFEPGTHTLILRSLRKLRCDEEILLAYTEIAATTKIRRQNLMQSHGFLCNCESCEHPRTLSWKYNAHSGIPEGVYLIDDRSKKNTVMLFNGSKPHEEYLENSSSCFQLDDALLGDEHCKDVNVNTTIGHKLAKLEDEFEVAVNTSVSLQEEILKKIESLVNPLNLQLYKVRGEVLSNLVDGQFTQSAELLARSVVFFLRVVYSKVPNHPMLALNMHTLAHLEAKYNAEAGLETLREAEQILEVAYGWV